MHDIVLVETIAFGLVAALFFALIARGLGLQPLVGYLVAGIAIGPYTPGYVGDNHLAAQLAEIGVILLMFGVGLHFHLKDLLAVRSIAIPGAIGQSSAAALCGGLLAYWAGWNWQAGLVLGVATAVASTVVLLRVLMDYGDIDAPEGHVAIGWLIVEDIITVLVLVLLPMLALKETTTADILKNAGLIILKLAILCTIVMFAGARYVPILLTKIARLRSKELFTLTILVLSISVATISYITFGASMALGAFLAGMVVGQSSVSHQAASDALPMRDAFAVLFFVSVGMLFDYNVIVDSPWLMLGTCAIVLIVKPLVAFFIVLICKHPLKTALTVSAGLAQIGEFSFILGEMGKKLGLFPGEGQNVIVGAAILSISINPTFFKYLMKLEPKLMNIGFISRWTKNNAEKRINKADSVEVASDTNKPKAIVVGYGLVGQTLAATFEKFGIEPIVIELNIDTVLALQAQGKKAIYGDASRPVILEDAGVKTANYLVITIPVVDEIISIIETVVKSRAPIPIFARCRYAGDRQTLEHAGALAVSCEEVHTASAMAENVLSNFPISKWEVRKNVKVIQERLRLGL